MSESNYLRWDGKQLDRLQDTEAFVRGVTLSALVSVHRAMREAGWEGLADPAEVVDSVLEDGYLLAVPTGWIVFTVGRPWFLTDDVVAEEFITPGTSLTDVVDAMTAVAKRIGAGRIMLGTRALGDRQAAAAKLYERLGCRVSTVEITKRM